MSSLIADATRIAETYQPPSTGRPSLLADQVAVTELLTRVAEGNYIETACTIAGIAKQTLYRWLKEAEQQPDPNHPLCRFRDALKKAEAMAEAEDVANVRKAGRSPQYWAASMTHLERRHPERWAKRSDLDAGPKVIVQIGIGAESVPTVANLVNVIDTYQTQRDSEVMTGQQDTAPYCGADGAKVLGESLTAEMSEDAAVREQARAAAQGRENP